MLLTASEGLPSAAAVTEGDTGLINVDGNVVGTLGAEVTGVETEEGDFCWMLAGSGVVVVLSLSSGVRSELVVSVSALITALQGTYLASSWIFFSLMLSTIQLGVTILIMSECFKAHSYFAYKKCKSSQ